MAAPVISDEALLTKALAGCDTVVAVPISVRKLKATELVASLAKATAANGVKRLVFTAGEITAVHEEHESYTLRQKMLLAIATTIMSVTPYSLTDMRKATALIKQQPGWEWTICGLSEVNSKHTLSREDYTASLLDIMKNPDHQRRMLTVVSAN